MSTANVQTSSKLSARYIKSYLKRAKKREPLEFEKDTLCLLYLDLAEARFTEFFFCPPFLVDGIRKFLNEYQAVETFVDMKVVGHVSMSQFSLKETSDPEEVKGFIMCRYFLDPASLNVIGWIFDAIVSTVCIENDVEIPVECCSDTESIADLNNIIPYLELLDCLPRE